jgi:tetratricopeptide (TPR) repeat protein
LTYALLLVVVRGLYRDLMAETRNETLAAWMTEHQVSVRELADAVNEAIWGLTGRLGSATERTVFRWLSGENRWPQERQRRALETVTGCTATALGFVPRGNPRYTPALPMEDPSVHRRRFCGAATGTAAAVAVPLIAARPAVGTSDVIRLRNGLDTLTALDQSKGGHAALEKDALAGASEAVGLQGKAASQQIRHRLFSVAANYTATAAWSCIDARQFDRARSHLNDALRLAGMAQDPLAQMRVWNSTAILAHQRGDVGESIAAAQAAQATAITRRDPLFASLAHARTAVGHAQRGDRQAAVRSLGHAEEALGKAEVARPRPGWVAFYGPAELHALAAIVREQLGEPADAEAASHRALAVLPKKYRRNRAMATVYLALAQLHQGDVEQACATTEDAFTLMSGSPLPERLRVLLGDFYRDLLTRAPSAQVTREWGDRFRSEWSTR